MNESEKNIETCLPESILAEVASVPQDPQFVSLVNESLDPLKQQAFQQAGSDAYNEVVASHQPYTFTSQVAQMKSNLILLLRRLWRFPFGTGTIRSLADMWAHYIPRLQGSETYGIPSRLDQLTDLPSAPLLVADRKISNGGAEDGIVDGMSLAHLLCSAASSEVTKLIDDNHGWTMIRTLPTLGSYTHVLLGCKYMTGNIKITSLSALQSLKFPDLVSISFSGVPGPSSYEYYGFFRLLNAVTELEFPMLEVVTIGGYGSFISEMPLVTKLSFPNFKEWQGTWTGGLVYSMQGLTELEVPNLSYVGGGGSGRQSFVIDCPNLTRALVGPGFTGSYGSVFAGCTALIDLEFSRIATTSQKLTGWSPTLDSSNLQQFLSNFRSFIVLRLANRKSTTALTLTLSAAVYNAVTGANSGWASQHTLAELGITDNDLTDLETELGITSATIYATWLDTYTGANGIHWDINKAN